MRTSKHYNKNNNFLLYKEKDLIDIIKGKKDVLLLILDCINDPHNLGACIRTANATAVDGVIIPKNKSVSLTETVKHISCGAFQYTPVIQVNNIHSVIRWLKKQNIWIVGTSHEATSNLYQQDFKDNVAVVLGNEEKGIRSLTAKECDFLVSIPMLGEIDCLNISVSCGVILYEVIRQRKKH